MFFHWAGVYGLLNKKAIGEKDTAKVLVDKVFARAASRWPEVFAADSLQERARAAKFEAVCLELARLALEEEIFSQEKAAAGRAVLEEMVDRFEVGLREAGVGDLAVGRQVRKLAAAMHGRLARYRPLLAAGDDAGLAAAAREHGIIL